MTQSCLGKLTIWYFDAGLWFQSCAKLVFMQYFYLLQFVLISSKKLFSFVFQRIDTYQYNFLLRFLNLNLRACSLLEWVKSWFFPLQSWKYGEDQSTIGRGGSKQNGVRMHATDYENYVSKYLLQWKTPRANSGNVRNNVF